MRITPDKKTTRDRAERVLPGLSAIAVAAILACTVFVTTTRTLANGSPRPNVVLIVTDDQRYDELSSMPNVRRLISDEGVSFDRAYVSYPLCCPSRSSLLTGLYSHNHGVLGNRRPNGGWFKFRQSLEQDALPVWMKAAGYQTGFFGKYMNGYLFNSHVDTTERPPGWDTWLAKETRGDFSDAYFKYNLVSSSGPSTGLSYEHHGSAPKDYMTDVLGKRSLDFIENPPSGTDTPLFLSVWPTSPHYPFQPAPRDKGAWKARKLPPTKGSNEKDVSDKAKWLRQAFPKLSAGQLKRIDSDRRRRLEQLISVDDAIGSLIKRLDREGELDNTYIVFTSDNGYFLGEHRIPGGKYLPYEPSARVPLIVRGPGIPHGKNSKELVSLMDVPQTFLEIATGATDENRDGRSLLPYATDPALRSRRPLLIEGFSSRSNAAPARSHLDPAKGLRGVDDLEQEPGGHLAGEGRASYLRGKVNWYAPGYLAIRTKRYLLIDYAKGKPELYDMKRDPFQLRNRAGTPAYRAVQDWMTDLLADYADCSGESCRLGAGPAPPPPLD